MASQSVIGERAGKGFAATKVACRADFSARRDTLSPFPVFQYVSLRNSRKFFGEALRSSRTIGISGAGSIRTCLHRATYQAVCSIDEPIPEGKVPP
jgi:hypothetical protein